MLRSRGAHRCPVRHAVECAELGLAMRSGLTQPGAELLAVRLGPLSRV